MKENIYRYSVIALLAAILIVQMVTMNRVRQRIIVSSDIYGVEAQKKSPEERRAIMSQIPLVGVFGTVDVDIDEKPLKVQIVPQDRPLY